MKLPRAETTRPWLTPLLLTLAFAGLVAAGVADSNAWAPPGWAMALAAVGLGALHFMMPRGVHFAIGTTAGLGIYMTLFVVIGRAGFPHAEPWSMGPAFLAPVAFFLGACLVQRRRLRLIAERSGPVDLRHLRRMGRWLVPAFLVATCSMAFPVNRLSGAMQGLALLSGMALIGVIVAASVQGVVLLLVDTAIILEDLGERIAVIAVPMVAFTMVYSILVVAFAAIYRIADGLSRVPLFHMEGVGHWLAFPDALYMSLVTQATVGYGDVTPHDDGVRLLAAAQVVLGQLLLLFGFAELMRGRSDGRAPRPDAAEPPAHPRRNRPAD
ncbi:MAG: potassium channel family protein [Pseudomonadota bacterium]